MENICEWENCKETGKFKAPIDKDNSKKFRWLCEVHIKLFNKNWNYFEGMSQNQIEDFLKSDLTWHRPTQKFGSTDNFFNILWNNALSDKFKIFNEDLTLVCCRKWPKRYARNGKFAYFLLECSLFDSLDIASPFYCDKKDKN